MSGGWEDTLRKTGVGWEAALGSPASVSVADAPPAGNQPPVDVCAGAAESLLEFMIALKRNG